MAVSLTGNVMETLQMPQILNFDIECEGADNPGVTITYWAPNDFPHLQEKWKEIGKELAKDLVIGAVVGFVVGGAVGGAVKFADEASKCCKTSKEVYLAIKTVYQTTKIWNTVKACTLGGGVVGVVIGATAGMGYGSYRCVKFHKNLEIVAPSIQTSSDKSLKIINAILIQERTRLEDKEIDICCSISGEPYVVPVKTQCNHVFEFSHLVHWLKEQNTCPQCRADIRQEDLTYSQETMDRVQGISKTLFQYLENMIQSHILQKRTGHEINFYDRKVIAQIAREIGNDPSILESNQEEIIDKIRSNTLSAKEIYTLAYFLKGKIKPVKDTINFVYEKCKKILDDSFTKTKEISSVTYTRNLEELEKWYEKADPIPKKVFPIINAMR